MIKKSVIKILHPEFGHVNFEGVTSRQMDVLKRAKEILEKSKRTKKLKK